METKNPNSSLSASRPEKTAAAEPVNELPRAVLRPNTYMLLDGEWRFSLDPDDRGIVDRWYLGHDFAGTAQWPGSIEEHMEQADHHSATSPWHDRVVAWYERDFAAPERTESPDCCLVQLTFGACGYETRVWLNGYPLRTIEDEKAHLGEYTSFSYEIPDEHLRPQNRLTVRICDTMDAEIPRGKQESHVYKRGGIWYQTYTGAVRSVWLETVERNRLRTRIGVVSVVEDRLVRFTVTTRIHDPGDYVLRLQAYELGGTEPLAASDYPLRLEVGQKQQRVVLDIEQARLWSPESPTRYKLVAQLIGPDGYVAQVETRFGLRKIEARGRFIYLNNEPIYLDGILYQPGTATYEEMQRHMQAMKELGCNLVRVHIAGIDPRIYNLADKLGLLLWVEVPSPHSSTAQSRQNPPRRTAADGVADRHAPVGGDLEPLQRGLGRARHRDQPRHAPLRRGYVPLYAHRTPPVSGRGQRRLAARFLGGAAEVGPAHGPHLHARPRPLARAHRQTGRRRPDRRGGFSAGHRRPFLFPAPSTPRRQRVGRLWLLPTTAAPAKPRSGPSASGTSSANSAATASPGTCTPRRPTSRKSATASSTRKAAN